MKFFVFGQNLRAAQRIIASGTARVLTADFRFSPEWDGMRKYAHFEQGDKKHPVPILGNRISESANLNLGQGVWEVWVHGNRFDDDENFERITTVKAKISVDPSGLCGDPLPIEPPSFGEQLDERLSVLEAGGGGTADHSKLTNREQPDQHPMEAITGLVELRDKINAFLDADDSTLDQLTELIAAIKANQGTIEQLTNGKVNVSDIVNDLTTGGANKVLSAEMGKELKRLIDAVPDWAMSPTKPVYTAKEVGALPEDTDIPRGVSVGSEPVTPKTAMHIDGDAQEIAIPTEAFEMPANVPAGLPEDTPRNVQGVMNALANGDKTAILYTPQELTSEQKKQARDNIGATGVGLPPIGPDDEGKVLGVEGGKYALVPPVEGASEFASIPIYNVQPYDVETSIE